MSAPAPHLSLPLNLETAQVDLWLMSPDALDDRLREFCLGLLDGEERARYGRYRAPSAQAQFLMARALLRTVLSCYADRKPTDWQFDTNTYGKPRVADGLRLAGLHFNVSHAEGLVALAVSGQAEIGVDVEHVGRSMSSLDELTGRYFAPTEQALLASMADEESRTRAFFDVWTLKESYIQARGTGLSLALDSFDFHLPPDDTDGLGARLMCTAACGDDGARWLFYRARPTPDHTLALAAASGPRQVLRVVTRWVKSLQGGRPVLA
jgi:4'-phosphopantetheinyl transferase